MTMDTIRPIEDETAVRACFAVMHQLRPHLADADELVARWRRQVEDGYRLIAVWRGGEPVALAGYRLQENLVYGPFLYVDDLVTDNRLRSSGLGNVLMDHLKAEAARMGCTRLVLDTPLSNVLGHRFYYRNGLLAGALRFGFNTGVKAQFGGMQ
ncbi:MULTISPECIES: GNAT family N-acetyltransferase [Ralstonia]|uniref:GNAT family N-acetyltransferase n=1 Tax=Ralstonia TaxID=48736 RepID=UPI000C7A7F18|nr:MULTISPECIES: GNAT family N-acetyltransferase [Ralstonia]PLT17544.1 GNAT family N-acetyltransferase [Ralstonia mannitolilytica]